MVTVKTLEVREQMKYTHAEVVALCRTKAEACGWAARTDDLGGRELANVGYPRIPNGVGGRPDLILEKDGEIACALEVKSSYDGFHALKTGIGQCLLYHVYGMEPYLVFPNNLREITMACSWVHSVGFIAFFDDGTFKSIYGKDIFQTNGHADNSHQLPDYVLLNTRKERQLPLPMNIPPSSIGILSAHFGSVLAIPVSRLGLSTKATNILYCKGYTLAGNLLGLGANEVAAFRGAGIRICAELVAKQEEIKGMLREANTREHQ